VSAVSSGCRRWHAYNQVAVVARPRRVHSARAGEQRTEVGARQAVQRAWEGASRQRGAAENAARAWKQHAALAEVSRQATMVGMVGGGGQASVVLPARGHCGEQAQGAWRGWCALSAVTMSGRHVLRHVQSEWRGETQERVPREAKSHQFCEGGSMWRRVCVCVYVSWHVVKFRKVCHAELTRDRGACYAKERYDDTQPLCWYTGHEYSANHEEMRCRRAGRPRCGRQVA